MTKAKKQTRAQIEEAKRQEAVLTPPQEYDSRRWSDLLEGVADFIESIYPFKEKGLEPRFTPEQWQTRNRLLFQITDFMREARPGNTYNSLLDGAISTAFELGISPDEIAKAIRRGIITSEVPLVSLERGG